MCPLTFLLLGEGHQVLPVLVLQGRLLQVLLQGVAVERPRRALLRLVTLPEASGQHGILGEQEVKCCVDMALRLENMRERIHCDFSASTNTTVR